MSYASLTDFIRPVGSVYFSSINWDFDPRILFGGNWANPGTINKGGEVYKVWHRIPDEPEEEETSNG